MTRQTFLPLDPADPVGCLTVQTSGAWLTAEMRRRRISNQELYRRLRAGGFIGTSANIVSMWRYDATPIAPETLPLLLDALGLPASECRLWGTHFLHALHPRLANLVLA